MGLFGNNNKKQYPQAFDKEERNFRARIVYFLVAFHIPFHLFLRKPIQIRYSHFMKKERLLQRN